MNSQLEKRRESIRDLLEADLIQAGARLRFTRPRAGEDHIATVSASGRIVLDDGAEYDTPSDAARAVTQTQVNGWTAWRTDANRTLSSLRDQLRAIEGRAAGGTPQQYLADVTEQLDAGEAPSITVREFVRHWNARNRGARIRRRIDADLANAGLRTFPHFGDVALDTVVVFATAQDDESPTHAAKLHVHLDPISDALNEDIDPRTIGLKVGNIPSALGGVTHVGPDGTVEQAITLMQIDDFSQLAVLSGNQRKLLGAVTWQSIATARHIKPDAGLSDCLVDAPEIAYDQDLVDALSVVQSSGFVFVRNPVSEIDGIVTAADLAHAYGDMATPFFLIGELDQLLRHVVSTRYTLPEVVDLCDTAGSREIMTFDQLTMGDYERVLQNREAWAKLDTKIDRALFCERLGVLREIRNDIMHFNPEDIPANAVAMLKNLLRMIRLHLPI